MSVVACVASRYGSWVAYDGRGRNNVTGLIVSENIIKAKMVNKTVCVGYTGTLELAEKVISVLTSEENKSAVSVMSSDSVVDAVQKVFSAVRYPQDMSAQFLVVGVNSSGRMAMYTIDSQKKIACFDPSDTAPIRFAVLSNGEHGVSLEPYVLQEIKCGGLSNTSIVTGLTKFIHTVADKDDSVNKNVKIIELRT